MASLTISGSPSTTTNTITVNFTTDVSNISKAELSKDGGSTFINATSFNSSSAVFNISTWPNGIYNNCKLRLTYTDSSSSGGESGGGDSGGTETNPNILTGLVFGKGWKNSTNSITDNPNCWATVDRISVKANRTYKITCDANWLWVRTYDSNDRLVATLSTGSGGIPSECTFTPTTSYIRCGCYDPNNRLTYFKLEEV